MKRLLIALGVLVLSATNLPAGAEGRATDPLYRIPFASGTIDPAIDFEARDPSGHDLVLVQFERFGSVGAVQAVAATGAALVQPLAPVSYLVWADAAETRQTRQLPGVRWAGVLPSHARIAPSVTASTTALRITLVGTAGLEGLPPDAVRGRAFTDVAGAVVTVQGGVAAARELAANPRVYSIADAGGPPQLRDEKGDQVVARGTAEPPAPGYREFLGEIGADGTGVVVGHVDGGVDMHHPELDGAIVGCIDHSATGALCDVGNHDDVVGHGTHTLGVVLGRGSTGLGDVDGFDYGLGVAPGATAVTSNAISFNTFGGEDPFEGGFRPLYKELWDQGAILSQNSWGPSGTPQGYDDDTREMDTIVRDVDDATPGDQGQAFSLSIMNGGGDTSTQGTPDEGKNLIRVGGTGLRNATGRTSPGVDDLCTCTAHGPALDGRLLPDVVAPAQLVMSTRATQGTLCGLMGAASELPSPLHASCTGTSFASPHVSGAYAVFVEWYRQHFQEATPSPALVKAALVNGADDLAGGADADGNPMGHIPNNQQGWGRLNLGNVVDAWELGTVHVDQSVIFSASGDSHEVLVEPIDPSLPLKVSLVWTDAPGHGLGGELPAWVNDLDLTVTGPDGTAWLGNVFEEGLSTTGGEADRMNNIENVYLAAPGAGPFRVEVSAANLIGDGLPNHEGLTDQDFALVITNARPAASG